MEEGPDTGFWQRIATLLQFRQRKKSSQSDLQKEMQEPSALLEHVVMRILDAMYNTFPEIVSLRVKLSKMNPPLGGQTDRVSVTMER